MQKYKSILITGGTGSFGKAFVKEILEKFPHLERVVIYSRDELKQHEMSQQFSEVKYRAIRYFIGDVRDGARFRRACEGIDVIVHAAALKHVPVAEYNPMEFIKTNILGGQNIIDAALDMGVKKVVALSTDKAAAPINLYGATKLCSDKLFVAANNIRGKRDLSFSVVRYGNVIGSRGSVVPFFIKKRESGILPITHPEMTRFNISLKEGVNLVLFAIDKAIGGEIFVPKLSSYKILDMAEAIAPECKKEIVGIRPGEKLHEEMVTETDSFHTVEIADYYIILPTVSYVKEKQSYIDYYKAKEVAEGFSYNSGKNDNWLSVEQLRKEIVEHVDKNFKLNA